MIKKYKKEMDKYIIPLTKFKTQKHSKSKSINVHIQPHLPTVIVFTMTATNDYLHIRKAKCN